MYQFLIVVSLLAICYATPNEIAKLALQNPDLYGGDMLGIDGPDDLDDRAGIVGEKYRWPGGVVYYEVDESLKTYEPYIQEAIEDYHKKTCIRFQRRKHEKDYAHLFFGKGCYSHVGRKGGKQKVSLGVGCYWPGTIVHEFGHVLGFYHEQSRSDRDEYLTIFLKNVEAGSENNFEKLRPDQNILYNDFDYESIMIYGNDAFSKNKKDTMRAKNGQKLTNPYDKDGLNESDVFRVRKMYNCDGDDNKDDDDDDDDDNDK